MGTKSKKRKIVNVITPKLLKSIKSSVNSSYTIINDVTINETVIACNHAVEIGVTVDNKLADAEDIYALFPTLFKNPHNIMIPAKAMNLVKKHLPVRYLDKIHGGEKTPENRAVAVELCLLFLSQLASTHRNILNGESPEGWKSLRAQYLRELLLIDAQTYQHVEDALLYDYNKGSIIERGTYSKGNYSTRFRLGEAHRGKGYKPYELKSDVVRKLFKKSCHRKIKAARENVICANLLEFYKAVELPATQEVEDEGKRLIANNYTNKKGKRLISLNKKAKSHYKDQEEVCFAEDAVKIYKYLSDNGLLIPKAGGESSGGRVVDSFTLMPSWIRKLVKVNGQPMVECDYSCLHPNIAMSLYGGDAQYLTHESVSKKSGIDKSVVKIEHLSFFNKNKWSMEKSKLYDYYTNSQPAMIYNIITEKLLSVHQHKVTSRRLFKKEVEIMTVVIQRLNDKGIYVGYVYDALFCCPDHRFVVKTVMDEVIVEFGVYTTAKIG
jgi:hypothetical protein